MSSKDDTDNKDKKKVKKVKLPQNVVNFQDYKKSAKASSSSTEEYDEPDAAMFIMLMDEEFAKSFSDGIFPDGAPDLLDIDSLQFYVVGIPVGDPEESIETLVAATSALYEDIDFEEEYELMADNLAEALEINAQTNAENDLLKLHIKKLEKQLNKKSIKKEKKE